MGIKNIEALTDKTNTEPEAYTDNLEVSKEQMVHAWPPLGEHLWSEWKNDKPMPKATQYRTCVHPLCKEVEKRDVPQA